MTRAWGRYFALEACVLYGLGVSVFKGSRDKAGWMRAKLCDPDKEHVVKIVFENVTNADEPVEKHTVLTRYMDYSPPNYVHYGIQREGQTEARVHMQMYTTPTSRSCSKMFIRTLGRKAAFPWFVRLMIKLSKPTWAKHMSYHEVLDGDTVFLAEQGNALRSVEAAGIPWGTQYYTHRHLQILE